MDAKVETKSGEDQDSAERKSLDGAVTRPMIGNEAIARGAWEAGVRVAAAYPGTPSTEIMEFLGTYPAGDVHVQWSTNEKVSLDVAIGGSFAGVRSMTAMKHVGLNVASDALMSQAYIGVNGGLVLVVCDDPGIHSSQNEQDTRMFARFAQVPVLEPCDAQEAVEFTRRAFDISEEFDTPVIVRSTTRLSHTRSPVTTTPRTDHEPLGFNEDTVKNVIIPQHARMAHPRVLAREIKLRAFFNSPEFTRWEEGGTELGIITASTAYTYVKEVLPEASVLKLGSSYPLAIDRVREFYEAMDRILVIEELEPVIEDAMNAAGMPVEGKVFFPRVGEFSPEVVREGLRKAGILEGAEEDTPFAVTPTARPPVLCSGCPHITSYMAVRSVNARVTGDIGCYTLAAVDPLKAIDTCVSMGSSIGNAVGIAKAGLETRPIIATIGDSTFLHGGIPALIDAVYNDANITLMILDNHIVAMTGGQDHPGTGRTLRGEETHRVDFEEMVRACGVKSVKTIDSYDMAALYQALREAVEFKGVAVVISDRPCVLDPMKIKGLPMQVRADGCTACQSCMNLGCPSLGWSDEMLDGYHKVTIDEPTCIGCSLCAQICPSDCIQPVAK